MKLRDLSVRHRLTLNNAIMVFVPVLLLVIIGSTVFYGLRATGNFREREIELLWPEAGNSAPVLMGLSHIFTNVDGGERESLGRHVASMEEAGVEVAVIRDGVVVYETVPGQARELIDTSYKLASGDGNVLRWDDAGLVYRYISKDKKSIGVAIGPVPFQIGRGFFPPHMGLVWSLIAVGVFLLAAAIIVFIGLLLVRRMTRDIVAPLEDLQQASRRIARETTTRRSRAMARMSSARRRPSSRRCAASCRRAGRCAMHTRRTGRSSSWASRTTSRRP